MTRDQLEHLVRAACTIAATSIDEGSRTRIPAQVDADVQDARA